MAPLDMIDRPVKVADVAKSIVGKGSSPANLLVSGRRYVASAGDQVFMFQAFSISPKLCILSPYLPSVWRSAPRGEDVAEIQT